MAHSIKIEIQWTRWKVSPVYQFINISNQYQCVNAMRSGYRCIPPGPECRGFGVELRRSLYILPIAGKLQWVKVLYCLFECSFPRSKFGSANDSVSSRNQVLHESFNHRIPFIAIAFLVLDDDHLHLAKGVVWPLCFIRCRSLKPRKYSSTKPTCTFADI